MTSSPAAADVREEIAAIRREIEAALRSRIEDDVLSGALPPSTDATILAGHAFAVVQGMSTLAKDGADRGQAPQNRWGGDGLLAGAGW